MAKTRKFNQCVRVSLILAKLLNHVSECNVGTGILTFDGNIKISEKITYGGIQEHMQQKCQCKFSYGTIVQLCVARNQRRRYYKGVAKVTTQRARKG